VFATDDSSNATDASAQQLQQRQQQRSSAEAPYSSTSSSSAAIVGLMIVCGFNFVFMVVIAMQCLRYRRFLHGVIAVSVTEPTL